ncbi:hypothetical protein V2S66_10200 [Streptomyces sp. V4-01]|uniref:Uncharacterized protein n=1 Tax=Actinacidiphila polyblastidii TaxID=3110430 RepID=A0ABU7P944_9ACTN|nr:hypothetical protein [Streptomyces sp. V4-01]
MAGTKWIRQEIGPAADGQGWRPTRGGTLLHGADAPLYAALADQWRMAGRMVPGQTDAEWARIVGAVPRLTGV